jgi:flagellar basal body-associated protein FliL
MPTAPGPAAPGQASAAAGPARLASVDRRPPAEAEPDGPPKPKKTKKKLVVVLAIVVVLAAAGLVAKTKMSQTVYHPGEPVPAGPVVSLGTVTVALSDGGHLVQATIDLQMTKPASATEEADDSAHLEDVAVSVLGQQSYTALLASPGRTAVQQQLLTSFQQVLGPADGAPQVSAVYFTGFVLQ